jgi:protein-S-isoprenylcysteine O-methyltransferase Ste14
MATDSRTGTVSPVGAPWWKGTRGEWLVVLQVVLIALVLVGPRTWPRIGLAALSLPPPSSALACALMGAGAALLFAGLASLGRPNITPLPYPREDGELRETGAYSLVRHPMYGGGVIFALGWAIWVRGSLTLVYALALFVFADFKSRREEQWLRAKFAGYAAYQARVRKLIPFLY